MPRPGKRKRAAERNKDLRQRLFDRFAANREIHQWPHRGGYGFACPICERMFGAEALSEPPMLGLAHAYPEACGGRLVTLACNDCNSRIGTKFESQLALEHRITGALGGSSETTVRASGTIGDDVRPLSFDVSTTNGHVNIEVINRRSHPAAVQNLRSGLPAQTPIRFTVTGPHEPRRKLAVLHAAYMTAFAGWGYEYLRHADTAWIRDALMERTPANEVQYPWMEVMVGAPILKEPLPPLPFVSIAVAARRFPVVLACLPAPALAKVLRVVVLPGFGATGAAAYRQFNATLGDTPCRIEGKPAPDSRGHGLENRAKRLKGRLQWRAVLAALRPKSGR